MRSEGSLPNAKLAAALDTWADARERAVTVLKKTAVSLEAAGHRIEATRLRKAANHLKARMVEERGRASHLRSVEAQDHRSVEHPSDIEMETA
jgi:hypothetical protein